MRSVEGERSRHRRRRSCIAAWLLAGALGAGAIAATRVCAQPASAGTPSGREEIGANRPAAADDALTPLATPLERELAETLGQGAERMTADQAAAISIRSAPSVARATAATQRALAAADQAQWALWPRLDLEARYSRLAGVDDIVLPAPPGGQDQTIPVPRDRYGLQAQLTIPLSDVLLQMLPRYRAAKDLARAQALQTEAELHTVALLAREAFYNYARARASEWVARASVTQTESQRRDVGSMVSAGSMARVELMRAEAQVASARGALARAQGAVAVGRSALFSLLHRAGERDLAIDEPLEQPPPALHESSDRLLQRAIERRSELRALRAMQSAQEFAVDATLAGRLPRLSVGASYDYAKPNPNVPSFREKPPWSDNWLFYGALSWSPNDFAVAGDQRDQAQADKAQTLADIQSLHDALRREVTQAAEGYRSSAEAMDAGLVGIRAAEESYRVRREQFRAGAAVATDVVDAEAELRRARLELINAAIDVRIAQARLDRAVQSGLPALSEADTRNQP